MTEHPFAQEVRQGPRLIVSGRQGGKTSQLIQWVMNGRSIPEYPGWSRIIVCCYGIQQVITITKRLREATAGYPENAHTWDLRKAVWSLQDLNGATGRDWGNFEIAFDDVEALLYRQLPFLGMVGLGLLTITGRLATEEDLGPDVVA